MFDSNDSKTSRDGISFRSLGKLSVGTVVTRDNRVVYCNEFFATMVHLDQESLIGQAHPFLRDGFVSGSTAKALASYLDDPQHATSIRVDFVRADGLPAWNEVQLCREDDYLIWMHRDVTQQMATHELWKRHEFILDASQQYMALINRDYDYQLVNRSLAAAFGTTPDEVMGTAASTLWGTNMFSSIVAPHLEACFEGEEVRDQHWVDLPVGGNRCLDMIYTPYKDPAGTVIHAVFVAWDVTMEKRATEAVRTINRELEQRVAERTAALQDTMRELEAFNYTIAHDLRTPLRFLKSFAQMLDESSGAELDEPGRYMISMISQGVAEMQHMIDRLLDFSNLSRKPLVLERCKLDAVLQTAQRAQIESRNTIHVAQLPNCRGDQALLKQVFVNLLQNAVKFSASAPNPRITVYPTIARPGMVCVCVEDNGLGFNMSHAETMFSPFKQIHDVADNEGSGLGLAIVRRIVERHGGRVWAESSEGEGARFYVELLASDSETEPRADEMSGGPG